MLSWLQSPFASVPKVLLHLEQAQEAPGSGQGVMESTAAAKTSKAGSSLSWEWELMEAGDGEHNLAFSNRGQKATNGLETRCSPTVDLPNLK